MIMIIDDSPTIRRICEVALSRAGYEVQSFSDGIEALRYFCKPESEIPELILLDLAMPKVSGFALLQHFRKKSKLAHVPVVIMSRSAGIVEQIHARILGVKDYLAKPITTTRIVEAARAFGQEVHHVTS